MSHELDGVKPMVADPGTHQQPLTMARLLRGERLRLPAVWTKDVAEAEALPTELTKPPTITTIEELEALAAAPMFPEDEEEEEEPAEEAPEADDVVMADFGTRGIHADPSVVPLAHHELKERIALDCLDRLAGLAEHRVRWSIEDKPETERRCLAQVDGLMCLGEDAIATMLEAPAVTPWDSWAVVFTLACLEGREALEAIVAHVAALGPDQHVHRRLAAEAFAASANAHDVSLARACMAQEANVPFALELLSLRQHIGLHDLEAWLRQPHPETQATVLRAMTRLAEVPTQVNPLESLLDTPDPRLAWEASRALTLWGSGAPLSALRHGGTLLSVLGEQAVELLVLCGHHDDVELAQRLVRRLDPSPALLDAVARLGHPGTWAYLVHFLGDGILEEDAVAALRVAFGDIVPDEARLDADRWEQAIAVLGVDEAAHVRRGQAWSPVVVAAECGDPRLSREDLERRLDELHARSRIRHQPPLWAMSPLHQTLIADLSAALRSAGAI